jgi:DNA (cytosine-5)-methyltransferase 1
MPPLKARSGDTGKGDQDTVIAFTERTRTGGRNFEAQQELAYAVCNPGSGGRTNDRQIFETGAPPRRLTPRECERLQGLPDDWTAIDYRGKPAADEPRYRAIGNSMAVPVIGWVLARIRRVK